MSDSEGGFRFFSTDQLWLVSGESFEILNRAPERIGADRPVLFWHLGDDSFHLLGGGEVPGLTELGDIDEYLARRRAEVIALGERPQQLAVVLDGDGLVVGAWLAPESDEPESADLSVGSVGDLSLGSVDLDLGLQVSDDPGQTTIEDAELSRPAGEPVIRRTPHLDAPDLIPTAPGEVIEVVVRTNRRPFREAEEGADVVIEAAADLTEVELDVQLSVSDHFEVEGPATRRLRIRREENDSEPVRYRLRVVASPPERTAGICALFIYGQRPCGHVVRAWRWSNASVEAPIAPAHTALPASLSVNVHSRPPDVTVYVTAPVHDGTHFKCSVETKLVPGYERPEPLDFGLEEKAPELVERKLEPLSRAAISAFERRNALTEAGYAFWEAAPPVFKQAIWDLVDADKRGCSIFIASAEPSLPWELMIPTRHDGREPEEIGPLGVEFGIGRWSRGDAASPPQRIPVRDAFVVAPEYEDNPLDSAAEVSFVKNRLNGTRIEKATTESLDALFVDHHASLLHFICHGAEEVENDEAIYLDGNEQLRSEALRPLLGFKALCKRRAPLVFVNACNAGALKPALAGGAGFPRAFGDIGARAVLAPLWPVRNATAAKVAIELYDEALKPEAEPVAEILRSIRARAYAEADADTYAAYAFFGDPLARLELVTE